MDNRKFNKRIGKRLSWARTVKGLSQLDLAWSLDFHLTQIQRIENGHISTSFFNVYKICKELGISIDELVADAAPIN